MISHRQQPQPHFLFPGLFFLLIFILSGCNKDNDTSSSPGPDKLDPDDNAQSYNQQPYAMITASQSFIAGEVVTLDGSGSTDPNGDSLSYHWSQTNGPSIALSNSSSPTLTFVAPMVSQTTAFTFQLTVNDGALSNSASVSMLISPMSDNTSPSIISRSPQPDQREVSTTVEISASFNEALLESSVDNQSLLISRNGTPVAGIVSYDKANKTVTNKPTSALSSGATYTVTLASTLEDLSGNTFAGESWNFSTAGGTDSDTNSDTQTLVDPSEAVVVLFIIDGMQPETAATAIANGADNLKMIMEQGVTVEEAYSVSPSPSLKLPDGSKPWGGTSPPNVAIHTGCHVYDSKQMDDIFLAARNHGVVSVFVGGASAYSEFDTADFHYAKDYSDEETVSLAIQHLQDDGARLLRLHLQRIRDDWNGPKGKTDPNSDYIAAVVNADRQLGVLVEALSAAGVWENTYLIVAADHGMGSSGSAHPPTERSSWEIFMGFYGPGIKKGVTIPYAESPDMAILTAHLLGFRPLLGHIDPEVTINPKGATGTLLTNIFEGAPAALDHPQVIRRYLESENFTPPDDFPSYRADILELLGQ